MILDTDRVVAAHTEPALSMEEEQNGPSALRQLQAECPRKEGGECGSKEVNIK